MYAFAEPNAVSMRPRRNEAYLKLVIHTVHRSVEQICVFGVPCGSKFTAKPTRQNAYELAKHVLELRMFQLVPVYTFV